MQFPSCGERQRNMALLGVRGSGGVSSTLPRRFTDVCRQVIAGEGGGFRKGKAVFTSTVGDLHGTFRSIGLVT